MGAVAWGLLALALPSALTIPRTGPTTLAEFAPVPGRSEVAPAPIADIGLANSAGVGSGPAGTGSTGRRATPDRESEEPLTGGAGRRRGGTKRCVGRPPRQTEDPLSPPCIAFFEGDNSGATAKGVTASEIRLVILVPCEGSLSAPRIVDLDDPKDPYWDRERAAILRYFSDRYQFYERRLHGWTVTPTCSPSDAVENALVLEINERIDPFAVIAGLHPEHMARAAAERGIHWNLDGGDRQLMERYAPYLRSDIPDLQNYAQIVAGFLCHKLAGRPARYSGEPADRSRTRRFALYYDRSVDPDGKGEDLIRRVITDRCGQQTGPIVKSTDGGYDGFAADFPRWRHSDGVTSILQVGALPLAMHHVADSMGWYPEWIEVPDVCCNYSYQAASPTQQRNAFGLVFYRRLAAGVQNQDWYVAARESCGDCANPRAIFSNYQDLLVLAWGIQAAGPRLTAANLDLGLASIPPRPSPNPWTPAAYFTFGNHSFFKDAAVVRWDGTGQPNAIGPPGCWRMVYDGKRFRAEDFDSSSADEGFDHGWPCNGEPE